MSNIPLDLITQYIQIIRMMENAKNISITFYSMIDKQRREVHQKILDAAGKDREDQGFEFELARLVEEALNK